jgi:flagellin
MPLQIATNTAAHRASHYLSQNQARLQKSIDRLASGKRLVSPVEDPGSLAVAMKLEAAINRISGAMNNVDNAISFLEVQDGMLENISNILDRMSELKGLASQDPMKSDMDRVSYDNEFKDLQVQLYAIAQMKFNGVSLFAQYATSGFSDPLNTNGQALFGGMNQSSLYDNTISIHTSSEGSSGSRVSLHRSLLLSALTIDTATLTASIYTNAVPASYPTSETLGGTITFATEKVEDAFSLQSISVGVITQALEHLSFLRAQNGGSASRLYFASESLAKQKTNMRAALGRIVDADIAEETTNLAKYNVLSQAAASMLAQANSNTDIALMLIR